MKRVSKVFPLALLFLSIFIFQNILCLYLNKQTTITMETNALLSTHHIEVDDQDLYENIKDELSHTTYWMYKDISVDFNERIFAFYSNDYSSVLLPKSSGDIFQKENSKEALIGDKIKTIKNEGKEWIKYEDNTYQVVGRIGFIENSPVNNYILINDTSYFETEINEEILFDSVDDKKLDELNEFDDVHRNNYGVERMFAISSYTNIIRNFSLILIISMSIITSIAFIRMRKDENKLKFHIGISSYKLVLYDLISIILINILFILCSILFHNLYSSDIVLLRVMKYSILTMITMIITYIIKGRKQIKGWLK